MAALIEVIADSMIKLVNKDFEVKCKQLEAMKNIIESKDTLAILPTSYGKSLIFQMLPSVCKKLPSKPDNGIVLVISSLQALIADQVKSANKMKDSLGLNACSLSSSSKMDKVLSGEFNIIVDSPELWMGDPKTRKAMLSSPVFTKNLICIVVDEAHKVSWGVSNDGEKPFRKNVWQNWGDAFIC
ncbi:probable ATP-dependent DNA helicase RecS [Clytia hemisphaerica]|uniref:probable ATP-dependent DNA helicase RecS n=1 Tax=Clytia hemisphaerica TaxID=252671 RepID=UPI0034D65D89